jgi:hypothetical protein
LSRHGRNLPANAGVFDTHCDSITIRWTQGWSRDHHLPIYYGEFGCTHAQNASTGRDTWYAAHAAAIRSHGFAASVWDDDGMFRVFDRNANTWDVDVLKALGKHNPGKSL